MNNSSEYTNREAAARWLAQEDIFTTTQPLDLDQALADARAYEADTWTHTTN